MSTKLRGHLYIRPEWRGTAIQPESVPSPCIRRTPYNEAMKFFSVAALFIAIASTADAFFVNAP